MRVALRLARRGLGRTTPNPPVGAVIVKRGEVVGRGFHRRVGEPHAEVEAIASAAGRTRGATMYVTLEPCNHRGRTPPCTEAVLAAGIRRLVIGAPDPNPDVVGGGALRLRRAGLRVVEGVELSSCLELLRPFSKRSRTGLPFVTLKLAATLDGRIATRSGDSRWVSGEQSRTLVHRWRDEMDALMVGAGTVIADDPELTCRRRGGRDPLRVIVDGRLRMPLQARVLTKDLANGTLVATTKPNGRKLEEIRRRGVMVEKFPNRSGRFSLRALLRRLGRRGLSSVLLEGGAITAAAALREGVVDRLACFVAPKLVGGDGKPMLDTLGVRFMAEAVAVHEWHTRHVGEDLLIECAFGGSDD